MDKNVFGGMCLPPTMNHDQSFRAETRKTKREQISKEKPKRVSFNQSDSIRPAPLKSIPKKNPGQCLLKHIMITKRIIKRPVSLISLISKQ